MRFARSRAPRCGALLAAALCAASVAACAGPAPAVSPSPSPSLPSGGSPAATASGTALASAGGTGPAAPSASPSPSPTPIAPPALGAPLPSGFGPTAPASAMLTQGGWDCLTASCASVRVHVTVSWQGAPRVVSGYRIYAVPVAMVCDVGWKVSGPAKLLATVAPDLRVWSSVVTVTRGNLMFSVAGFDGSVESVRIEAAGAAGSLPFCRR